MKYYKKKIYIMKLKNIINTMKHQFKYYKLK